MSKQAVPRVLFRGVRTISLTLLITAVSVIGLTVSGWSLLKSNTKAESINTTVQDGANLHGSSRNTSPHERVEVVRITIRPTGFEPSEIVRPAGPFLLVIDNKSGLEDINLQIQRLTGGRRDKLHDIKVSLKQLRKAEITNLPVGQYELTEATHTDWICRVTIN